MRFELFVALRYLTARRKQAVISIITAISVAGVAAGVMALIIALAINNGFRGTLQRNLLGATAHVSVQEKNPRYGIAAWRELLRKMQRVEGVVSASPTLYSGVYLPSPVQPTGVYLKGIDPAGPDRFEVLGKLIAGSSAGWTESRGRPGIILGSRLARSTGFKVGDVVSLLSPQGELTPLGSRPSTHYFRVTGIFETGFFDLDAVWAYATLGAVQRVLGLDDVVNAIELRVRDIDGAEEVAAAAERAAGNEYGATHWKEQHAHILGALKMERTVTVITIGLIQMVAALNILISLVMMVMEKNRDIALLLSMGARREQIRNIFLLQGVLIGVAGTILGLVSGYGLSYLADRHRWITLDSQVYALSYVPFEPRLLDALWVPAAALLVSLLATLYPARSATRIAPAEALRYE
ncbi:MAG: ABC transporter permease [Bryobacteraceae bacterium]